MSRYFSSYGPIDKKVNYFVPRTGLMTKAANLLKGDNPNEGGHYITVWAPRQTGKSSLLRDIYWDLLKDEQYLAAYITIQSLKGIDDTIFCMNRIINFINRKTMLNLPDVSNKLQFEDVFLAIHLPKPLILIIDEFDSLSENVINDIAGVFRNIYHSRKADTAPSSCKEYLLHGLALIGVRSVVGIENESGSPFNVQRSLRVHNLNESEVCAMYNWYQEESGQIVEQEVIERIFYITNGHPGLVSWFGELLTREFNHEPDQPITISHFKRIYTMALQGLPNNTIINIISKAEKEPYRQKVLELFKTGQKAEFRFENKELSYLYMNGIISYEQGEEELYVRFPGQFIQEKLFDHFSLELVRHSSQLLADPFIDLAPVINDERICIRKLLELYQAYYTKNRDELLQYAQRRVDMRVMEVVYHFQIYSWLDSFLRPKGARVLPEFPTGNGKIDILIHYAGLCYGLELKSFADTKELARSVQQASAYGKSLPLDEITLVVFIDSLMPEQLQHRYSQPFEFADSSTVNIFFMVTG